MANRIREKISEKEGKVLNIYFTAGYPGINDTVEIIKALEENGADLVELGIPYSDPLADGATIQESSARALKNGMTLDLLFTQLESARKQTQIPIILMGYYNQMLQYGEEKFIRRAAEAGGAGLIIPDLPMDEYESSYKSIMERCGMAMSFLVTPLTSDNRIHQADKLSSAFLYVVSQSSITGKSNEISVQQKEYFEKLKSMNLESPRLIGFGIHDHETFETACKYADGAIIGSAFIRALNESENLQETVAAFIKKIKG